jgi:hypothetical protein
VFLCVSGSLCLCVSCVLCVSGVCGRVYRSSDLVSFAVYGLRQCTHLPTRGQRYKTHTPITPMPLSRSHNLPQPLLKVTFQYSSRLPPSSFPLLCRQAACGLRGAWAVDRPPALACAVPVLPPQGRPPQLHTTTCTHTGTGTHVHIQSMINGALEKKARVDGCARRDQRERTV